MTTRSRGWCITINNYTDDDLKALEALAADSVYLCYSLEVGASGTPHVQGYVYFDFQRSLRAVKRALPRAHLQPSRGSSLANRDYCAKESELVEFGTRPTQGKRSDLSGVRESFVSSNSISHAISECTSYQAMRGIELMAKYIEPQRSWKTHVSWYTSYSKACAALPEKYFSYAGSWDGYDGHRDVFMTVGDLSSKWSMYMLLFSHHPYRVDLKGGSRQFVAERIVVFSPYSPLSLVSHTVGHVTTFHAEVRAVVQLIDYVN